MNDLTGIAQSIQDRMITLVVALANYPGQPTVTQWDQMQQEAKGIVAASKKLKEMTNGVPKAGDAK